MISLFGSLVGNEELKEVRDVLNSQWLGMGPKTALFEREFSHRLGLKDFVLLNSCSNALYMAVRLLDLPPGSEIIVPSFTWVACAHSIVLAGHTPVFCDVDCETQNVNIETISRCVTLKTRAIMIVHYAGLPVEIEEIEKLGFPIIEDCAHAVDSKRRGRYCGSLGAIGVYSFDSMKNIAMGEGGGLSAQESRLIERARKLRYCGVEKSGLESAMNGSGKNRWWENQIVDCFPKMLPSDVSAAIGLAQLRKINALQNRRREIWRLYQEEFEPLSLIARPQEAPPQDQHSYFTYCIRISGGQRDLLARFLYTKGIYTSLRYHPLHLNSLYRSSVKLPVSEQLNEEALCLPLHPGLSDSDVAKVIDTVKEFSLKRA